MKSKLNLNKELDTLWDVGIDYSESRWKIIQSAARVVRAIASIMEKLQNHLNNE